jgi:hypothetical protein
MTARKAVLGIGLLSVLGLAQYPHSAGATAPSSNPVCQSLTSSISSDKNYYIFTASAAPGDGDAVTGYVFDFGDHQSYSFSFGERSSRDRDQATATHIYSRPGKYLVVATVLTKSKGKVIAASSPSCQLRVTVGEVSTAGTLVNTGPGSTLGLFISAVMTGMAVHYYHFLKRRPLLGVR